MSARISRTRPATSRINASGIGFGIFGLVAIGVLLWTVLGPNPDLQVLSNALAPPAWLEGGSWANPLGTDALGRDLLSRIGKGAALTIFISVCGVIGACLIGVTIGLVAGFLGGGVDLVLGRLIDAQLALPLVLVAIALSITTNGSIVGLIVTLAIVGWAEVARVVRADALAGRGRPYVRALEGLGFGNARIMFRHMLPTLASTVVTLAAVQVATLILVESALSFLGVGVTAPAVTWGLMLAEARDYLRTAWWLAVWPGIAITLTVFVVNRLGDTLIRRIEQDG